MENAKEFVIVDFDYYVDRSELVNKIIDLYCLIWKRGRK